MGAQKWEALKGGEGEPRNLDKGRRRQEAIKKALFFALNTWLGGPILMGKIGDSDTKSNDVDEEQRGLTNIRSLLKAGGYTYAEFQAIINRITEQKTRRTWEMILFIAYLALMEVPSNTRISPDAFRRRFVNTK